MRCKAREVVMSNQASGLIVTAAVAAAIAVSIPPTLAQAQAASGAPLKTPWGEPDLQGIWTDEFETPLQRPAKYANQEFFTSAQRADLDRMRSGILDRRATERDANNGYNGVIGPRAAARRRIHSALPVFTASDMVCLGQ
jgi:hypothetical protein